MKSLEKRRVKTAAKKLGFYAKGDFLIGTRSADVISGLAIDSAPSSTYVWTFLLPAFDDIEFMHMTLGYRAINLTLSDYPVEIALSNVWKPLSDIKNAGQLVAYLAANESHGEYANWTRFLCYIRMGKFDQAHEVLGIIDSFKSAAIPRKLKELESSRAHGGWSAVQDLLGEWSSRTDKLMVGIPEVLPN